MIAEQSAATLLDDLQPAADVLGGVIEAYRRVGFDAGYRRAVQELHACLVYCAAEQLHEAPETSQSLRKILYTYIERVQRELDRDPGARHEVEGGLGI